MKKGTCILLVYAILMTLLVFAPFTANANEKDIASTGEIIDSGITGDCTWTLDDKGLLTISGNGEMDSSSRHPWGYDSVKSIVIENGVTSIGNAAFYECMKLTSIDIPDSVTSIGSSAFYACKSLTSISIPNSVTSIGSSAFDNCYGLKSIDIPNSVTSIGSSAFAYCSALSKVSIPDSVESIGSHTFSGCKGLTNIDIPDSVKSIGSYAFYNCTGLTSIDIPDSVQSIGDSAFYGASITSVTIPVTVTEIYEKAFGYYDKQDFGETKVKDFTIYGYTDSEAERYANDNNFIFVALDEPSDPTSSTKRDFFGDIDGDGKVTVLDATAIQRYTAEIDTPYPIGDKIK